MRTFVKRRLGALMMAVCLFAASTGPATADDPLTVDDLLGLEAFGRADISPDGRWAIYEKRAGYNTLSQVDLGGRSTWAIMDLWLVDLAEPEAPPQRLLPDEGLGLLRLAWSPEGDRLLIARLRDGKMEYGIVSLGDGSARWTGLTPELPLNGIGAVWASNDTLLLITRPDGSLPLLLGYDRTATSRRTQAWERTIAGREPSRTVVEAHDGVLDTETPEPRQALVRFNVVTGAARTLAEGRIADVAVSPDGRRAAVVRREEQRPLARPEMLHMEEDRRHRLSVIDLETERSSTSDDEIDIASHLLRWSPDSRAVLVWGRRDHQAWSDGRLLEATTEGMQSFVRGGLEVGASAAIVLNGVKADWIDTAPVMYAKASGSERWDWHLLSPNGSPRALTTALKSAPTRIASAGSDGLRVFADGGYWLMTAAGVRSLSSPSSAVREALVFDPTMARRPKGNEAPRREWSPAISAEGERLVLTDDGVSRLGFPGGAEDRVVAQSDQTTLVIHPTGLSEALTIKTKAGERSVDAVNLGLADIVLTEATPIRHPDLNGVETTSWLFLPRGPSREVKGLIVRVYPGWADNQARVDPLAMTYSYRPEVFVAAGYAVLSPSIPDDLPVRERGEAWSRSTDLAVDAALAAFPELPSNRMVVWGHSFGGYATLEIATRSSRYRSYIASAAYSDMQGLWGEFDGQGRIQPENGIFFRFNQGWTEVGQGDLAAPPSADPELYAVSSPFLRADRIRRPVLFLTADMDFAPMSQSERMFSAILRNGGDARMVTYWGEKHIIWSPANIRDYYGQIFDWLNRTLSDPDPLIGPAPNGLPTSGSIPPAPPPSG